MGDAYNEEVEQPGTAIPPNAKMVFKGKIFEVWQWEQKLFDGTTTIFEKARRPDTVEVITVTPDRNILLEEQEQPPRRHRFFSLPGGKADGGEEPMEEVKRELLEETGYTSDDWDTFKVIQPFFDSDYRIHYFIARGAKKIKEPNLDAGEKITVHLLNFDEFIMLSENPAFRGTEFTKILLRLQLHPEEKELFRKQLFD